MNDRNILPNNNIQESQKITNDPVTWVRSEASDVKDCFTQFSFQAMAFSATIVGIIFGTMEKLPLVVLSAIPVVFLLMVVCRIGIHKYTTCNRSYGYQLYLEQSKITNFKLVNQKIHNDMKNIGWEESLRAWRIVQPAIFQEIYTTLENKKSALFLKDIPLLNLIASVRPDLYRPREQTRRVIQDLEENKTNKQNICLTEYLWFMPYKLTQIPSKTLNSLIPNYHAGTYLRDMIRILTIMQFFLMLPMGVYLYFMYSSSLNHVPDNEISNQLLSIPFLLIILATTLTLVICRALQTRRRREILENEFHSIHSCAITWHLVLLVHYRAVQETKDTYYCQYVEKVMEITKSLTESIFSIDQWIEKQYKYLESQISSS
jgi:hypothetical protein